MLAALSIRYTVCNLLGDATLEDNYAKNAKEVSNKKIKNTIELYNALNITPDNIPNDKIFFESFSNAKVSKSLLARWYLSELELEAKKDKQKIVNPDTTEVNLEHICPQNSENKWQIPSEYITRIGNLALLKATENSTIGNESFNDKKQFFLKSPFKLTQSISNYSKWGIEEIENRQKELAKLAVKRWKVSPY